MEKVNNEFILNLIAELVFKINLAGEGKQCAFLEVAGHVNWLQVRVVESKENYNVNLYRSEYTDFTDTKELLRIADSLEEFLR